MLSGRDISFLMVHATLVEESRLERKNREFKRARPYEGGTSNGKLEIHDKPKFKMSFSNQVSSNFSKSHNYRESNLIPKCEEVVIHQVRNLVVSDVVRNMWVNV